MKNFKPGQKVVYRHVRDSLDDMMIMPNDNEIVTIDRASRTFAGSWILVEYPVAIDGVTQSFQDDYLFPLISDAVLEKELSQIPELV